MKIKLNVTIDKLYEFDRIMKVITEDKMNILVVQVDYENKKQKKYKTEEITQLCHIVLGDMIM